MAHALPRVLRGMIDEFRTPRPHGLHVGHVEDVDDPEKLGRVRVRITGMASYGDGGEGPEKMPWAFPCFPDAGDGFGAFYGRYSIWDVVWVAFAGDTFDTPVVLGSWHAEDEAPEEVRGDYPHKTLLYKSRRGHRIEVNDAPGKLYMKFTDASGNHIMLDTERRKLTVYWDGDREDIVTGDWRIRVDGSMETAVGKDRTDIASGNHTLGSVNGDVDIHGTNAALNASASATLASLDRVLVSSAGGTVDVHAPDIRANALTGTLTGTLNGQPVTIANVRLAAGGARRARFPFSRLGALFGSLLRKIRDPENTFDGKKASFPDRGPDNLDFAINGRRPMDELSYPPGQKVQPPVE